jgi:RNA polymerase sigma factor (sigma-70 family)
VAELCRRAGYGFIEPADFARRVFQRARVGLDPAGDPRAQLHGLCKNVYAGALHAACAGTDLDAQNRAYRELGLYPYRIAFNYLVTRGMSPALAETQAEDGVQEALLNIHRNIQRVENPGGFLDYGIQAVTRACSRAYQYPVSVLADFLRELPTSDPEARARLETAAARLRQIDAAPSGPRLDGIESVARGLQEVRAADGDLHRRISWIIRQLRRAGHPDEADLSEDELTGGLPSFSGLTGFKLDCVLEALAQLQNKDQRMVLALQYFSEFSDQQIATLLNTVKNNVYQLRRRGLIAIDRAWLLECLQAC